MPDLDALRDALVKEGEALLHRPRTTVPFTGDRAANALVNDLEHYPHAFVFGCLVDRQVVADWAWRLPALVRDRLGSFDIGSLATLDEADWVRLLREPTPAHRMPETMATVLFRATGRLVSQYGGDAARIWSDTPTSARLVRRFLEFHGAGPKIATMAANILVRDFRITLADHRYIDISADVQVKRVMARLGFVEADPSEDVVIYAARELNPEFPGIFDLPLWELGATLCRPRKPACEKCRFAPLCSFAEGLLMPPPSG